MSHTYRHCLDTLVNNILHQWNIQTENKPNNLVRDALIGLLLYSKGMASNYEHLVSVSRVSCVIFIQDTLWYSVQHLFGKDSQQLPSNFQRFKYRTVLVHPYKKRLGQWHCERWRLCELTLSNEVLLKLLEELKVKEIIGSEGLLSNNSFHGLHIFADGIVGVLPKTKADKFIKMHQSLSH